MEVCVMVICPFNTPVTKAAIVNAINLIFIFKCTKFATIKFIFTVHPDNIIIRSYRNEDAAAVLGIYEYYILNGPYTFEINVPELAVFSSRLRDISAKFPFYVLEKGGLVLGYAYACAHRERAAYRWAVETSVYLEKEFIGSGYGKILYGKLLKTLKDRHFTHAFALIGLPNEKSIRLHKSCGFTEQTIHQKAGWKKGKWIDVCWMRAQLSEPTQTPSEPMFCPSS